MTCAILVTPSLEEGQRKNHSRLAVYQFTLFWQPAWKHHQPVQQLQGHGVSIVVGHQVHSLVAQTQVGHQGFNHTGLLEDGVLMGPLVH